MNQPPNIDNFKSRVRYLGGFDSIKLSPHMRFRAGQRRLDWEKIKRKIRSGDIEKVEENQNPNQKIPYEEAYIIFLSIDDNTILVPFYILKNGTMKAVTVMRK